MTETISIERDRGGRTRGEAAYPPQIEPVFRRVYVVFTDVEGTLRAVRAAGRLAPACGGRVTLVHFRPLDFGTPLDRPAGISPAESKTFLELLAREGCDVDVAVCVCRDARRALPSVIDRHSLVLVGGHHHWWRTGADRWRRTLEQAGYVVVVVTGTNEGHQRGA